MQRLKRHWNEAAAKMDDVTPWKFPHAKLTHSCMHVILLSSVDVTLSTQIQFIRQNAPQMHADLVIGIQRLFRPLSVQNFDILSESGDLTCCSSLADSLCLYKSNLHSHICTLLKIVHHLLDGLFSISCKEEQLVFCRTHSSSATRNQPGPSLGAVSIFTLHERRKPPYWVSRR